MSLSKVFCGSGSGPKRAGLLVNICSPTVCVKSQLPYLHKEGVVWMNLKAFPAPDTCEFMWLAV